MKPSAAWGRDRLTRRCTWWSKGRKGKAEVFEVIQEVPKDAQQKEGWASSRPGDTRYDVRFAGASQSFWSEGEAAIAAQELAGAATE